MAKGPTRVRKKVRSVGVTRPQEPHSLPTTVTREGIRRILKVQPLPAPTIMLDGRERNRAAYLQMRLRKAQRAWLFLGQWKTSATHTQTYRALLAVEDASKRVRAALGLPDDLTDEQAENLLVAVAPEIMAYGLLPAAAFEVHDPEGWRSVAQNPVENWQKPSDVVRSAIVGVLRLQTWAVRAAAMQAAAAEGAPGEMLRRWDPQAGERNHTKQGKGLDGLYVSLGEIWEDVFDVPCEGTGPAPSWDMWAAFVDVAMEVLGARERRKSGSTYAQMEALKAVIVPVWRARQPVE